MIGIVSVLSLLSIRYHYTEATVPAEATYQVVGSLLKEIHSWTFMLGINTFLYSFLLFRYEIVPAKLAGLGIISSVLIFIAAVLEIFGIISQLSIPGVALAFPIFVYEIVLSIWLITSGLYCKNS